MAPAVIDPEKLRKRLDEVWVSLGQEASAQGNSVMRACALTLIAVVDDDASIDSAAETLAQLMRQHPSRAIVVALARGEEALLDAGVDARCWMPFGGRQQICSEQIVIRCSEKTLGEVPSVVLPLIVPDLPAVLWCASERAARSPALPSLAAPVGRVLFDTFRAADPVAALERLSGVAGLPAGPLIMDLSWTRLTRWRTLLAQVFENERYRAHLRDIAEAVIHYEGSLPQRVPPTALLLAGWLATRLGWPCDAARIRFEHERAAFPSTRLHAFELRSRGVPATRISILRTAESFGEVRVEMPGLEPVMNRVSLMRANDVLLLGEELAIEKPDLAFRESLPCALGIGRAASKS